MIKKFTLISILLFFILATHAQDRKWSLGVEFGLNYSNSTESTAPLKKDKPLLYKLGLKAEYSISEHFALQSGLLYSVKGIDSKGEGTYPNGINIDGSVTLRQEVIQLPMDLAYKLKLSESKIIFSMGSYLSYGIGGKTKAHGHFDGNEFSKEVNTFGNAEILNKIDFGVEIGAAYEIKHFILKVNYEWGLLNIGNKTIMGGEMDDYKNRIFSTSICYNFSII